MLCVAPLPGRSRKREGHGRTSPAPKAICCSCACASASAGVSSGCTSDFSCATLARSAHTPQTPFAWPSLRRPVHCSRLDRWSRRGGAEGRARAHLEDEGADERDGLGRAQVLQHAAEHQLGRHQLVLTHAPPAHQGNARIKGFPLALQNPATNATGRASKGSRRAKHGSQEAGPEKRRRRRLTWVELISHSTRPLSVTARDSSR